MNERMNMNVFVYIHIRMYTHVGNKGIPFLVAQKEDGDHVSVFSSPHVTSPEPRGSTWEGHGANALNYVPLMSCSYGCSKTPCFHVKCGRPQTVEWCKCWRCHLRVVLGRNFFGATMEWRKCWRCHLRAGVGALGLCRAATSAQGNNDWSEEALLAMQTEEAIQLSLALEASRREFEREEKFRALYQVTGEKNLEIP